MIRNGFRHRPRTSRGRMLLGREPSKVESMMRLQTAPPSPTVRWAGGLGVW
jgi:hypothetical protein